MARFRFGLQALLEYRTRVVDERKQHLASCRHACERAERELRRLDGLLRSRSAGRAIVAELNVLERAAASHAAIVAQRRDDLWLATRALANAERQRGAIEQLKARRRAGFEADARRREALEIEEANARVRERARKPGGNAS